jgi:hypothetical protein
MLGQRVLGDLSEIDAVGGGWALPSEGIQLHDAAEAAAYDAGDATHYDEVGGRS